MVSKNRGSTVITFVPGDVRWPRGWQRNGAKGLRPGRPRARRRGVVEAATRGDYLPRPGRVRTTCPLKRNCKRPHLSLSLSKFRFPPKVSSPARNIVSRPFIIFVSLPRIIVFFFFFPGRRGGNGEGQDI